MTPCEGKSDGSSNPQDGSEMMMMGNAIEPKNEGDSKSPGKLNAWNVHPAARPQQQGETIPICMMSTTCGSDDGGGGRKRPWNPSLDSNPSKIKKAKKRLNSLAERALAALADDGGGISGSDNEKEDVTSQNNSQYKKISHASLSDISDGCSDKWMENCGTDKQSTIQLPEVTDLTTGGEEDDDEVVVPHHPLSEYGDALSCFKGETTEEDEDDNSIDTTLTNNDGNEEEDDLKEAMRRSLSEFVERSRHKHLFHENEDGVIEIMDSSDDDDESSDFDVYTVAVAASSSRTSTNRRKRRRIDDGRSNLKAKAELVNSSNNPHYSLGIESTLTLPLSALSPYKEGDITTDITSPSGTRLSSPVRLQIEGVATSPMSYKSPTKSNREDDDCKRAINLSLDYATDDVRVPCRKLNRHEFKVAVDEFIKAQGGYEGIENGQMIKAGNTNTMHKSCVVDGGGQHQTGAEYGRYSISAMWRLLDVLEGKEDIWQGVNGRLEGLPGARITAFLDIGHGIGIQVLQAGLSHGVPARGVEIMKGRHLVAEALLWGVIDNLRDDPPDSSLVELLGRDFTGAIIRNAETNLRDEKLREFLLFTDKPIEVQKGLVIYINNAEDVFSSRANQNAKGNCLDFLLAKLFANMKVGGRMVTLTDISCYLTGPGEAPGWFRRDVFESGTDAVSWGIKNKSLPIFVLTKLDTHWFCQSKMCPHIQQYNNPAQSVVVNDSGELVEECAFCEQQAKRCPRWRKSLSNY